MGRSLGAAPCNDSIGCAATFTCNGETSTSGDLNLGSSTTSADATSSLQHHNAFACAPDFRLLDRPVVMLAHEQPTTVLPAPSIGLGIELAPGELYPPSEYRSPKGSFSQMQISRLDSVEPRGPSKEPNALAGASSNSSSAGNGRLGSTGLQSACVSAPARLRRDTGAECSNIGSPTSVLRSAMLTQVWRSQLMAAAALLAAGTILVMQFSDAVRICARQFLAWLAAASAVRSGAILGSHIDVTRATVVAAAAPMSLSYMLAVLRPAVCAFCAAAGLLVCARTLHDFVRQRRLGGQEVHSTVSTSMASGLGAGAPSGGGPTLAPSQHHSTSHGADPQCPQPWQNSQEVQVHTYGADVADAGRGLVGKDLGTSGASWSPFATEAAPGCSADAARRWRTSGGGTQRPIAAAPKSAAAGAVGAPGGFRYTSCDGSQPGVALAAALGSVVNSGSLLAACNSPSLQNWAMPATTSSEEPLLVHDISLVGQGIAAPAPQGPAPSSTNTTATRSDTDIHDGGATDSDTDAAAIITTLQSSRSGTLDGGVTTSGDTDCRNSGSIWGRAWSSACRMALPGLHLLDRPTAGWERGDRNMGPPQYPGGGIGCSGHGRPNGWDLLGPRADTQNATTGGEGGGQPQPLAHPGLVHETGTVEANQPHSDSNSDNDSGIHLVGDGSSKDNGINDTGSGSAGSVGGLTRVALAVSAAAGTLQSGLLSTARATLAAAAQLTVGGSGSGLYAVLWGHGFGGARPIHPRQSTSSVRQMVSDLLPLVTGTLIPRTCSDSSLNTSGVDPHGSGGDGGGSAAALLLNSAGAARKPAFSDLSINAGRVQVLSVDDEPVNQQVMRALLWAAEYDVLEAASGEEALELLQSCEVLPDLVLLDVTLGGELSGFEVCREIRCEYSPGELPVIMITCSSLEEDVIRGLAVGANDYMIKPLRNLELMARIKTQLALKRSIRVAAEARVNMSLLGSILPANVIRQLKQGVTLIAQFHEEVTILFSDIRGFTNLATEWPTEQIILMLNNMFTAFDRLCDEMGVYKVETIGDAYMIVSGHDGVADHAARMLRMATAMLQAVADMRGFGGRELQIRVGIHTGPAHSGVVGRSRPRYCFFGDTVNTASRMESTGFPMAIQVSESTLRAINSQSAWAEEFAFVPCGPRDIKGKGVMHTYLLRQGLYNEALMELAAAATAAQRAEWRRSAQMCPPIATPATAASPVVSDPNVSDTQDNSTAATVATVVPVDAVQPTSSCPPDAMPTAAPSLSLSTPVAVSAGSFSTGGSATGLARTPSGRGLLVPSPFSTQWPIPVPVPEGGTGTSSSGGDPAGDLDIPRYTSYRYHHPVSFTDAVSSAGTNALPETCLAGTLASPRMERNILRLFEATGCNQRLRIAADTSSGGAGQPLSAAVATTATPHSASDAAIGTSTGRDDASATSPALPPTVASRARHSGSGGSSATATSSSAAASITAALIATGQISEGPLGRSASGRPGGMRTLSPPTSARPSVDMLTGVSTSSTVNDDLVWGNGQATTTTDTGSMSIAPRNGLNASISRTASGASAGAGWGPHSPPRDVLVYGTTAAVAAGMGKSSLWVTSPEKSDPTRPTVANNGEDVGVDEPTFHGCLSAAVGRSATGRDKVTGTSRAAQRLLEQPRRDHHLGAMELTGGIGVSNFELRRSRARTSGELSEAADAAVMATGSNSSAGEESQAVRPTGPAGGEEDTAAVRGSGSNTPAVGDHFSGQMVGWSLLVQALDPERSLISDGAAAETLGEWMNLQPTKRTLQSLAVPSLASPQQTPQPPTLQALKRWHTNDLYDPNTSSGGCVTGLTPSAAASGGFIPVGSPSVAVAAEALAAAVDSVLSDSMVSSGINSHAFGGVATCGMGSAGRPYSPKTIQQSFNLGLSNRGRLSIGSSLGREGTDTVRGPFSGTQASSNGSIGPQTLSVGTVADVTYRSAVQGEDAAHPPPTENPHASRLYCTSSQGGVMLATRPMYDRQSDASVMLSMGATQRPAAGSLHQRQQHPTAAASGHTAGSQTGGDSGRSSMGNHAPHDRGGGGGSACLTLSAHELRQTGSHVAPWNSRADHRRAVTVAGLSSVPGGLAGVNASYFLAGGGSSGGGSFDGRAAAAVTEPERRAVYDNTVRKATTVQQAADRASSRDGVASVVATSAGLDQVPSRYLAAPPPLLSQVHRTTGSDIASRRKSADLPVISRKVGRAATVQGISYSAGLSNNGQASNVDSHFRHSTSSGQSALRHVQSAHWPATHPKQHLIVPETAGGGDGSGGGVLSSYGHIVLGSAGAGVSIISQRWSNLYDPLYPRPRLTDHYASGENLDEPYGAQISGVVQSPSGSGHAWENSPVYTPHASGADGLRGVVGGSSVAVGGSSARVVTGASSHSYRGPAGYRDQVTAVSRPSLDFIGRASSLEVDAAEFGFRAGVQGHGQGPLALSAAQAAMVGMQPTGTAVQQKTHVIAPDGSQLSKTSPRRTASMQRHAYDKIVQSAYQTGGSSGRDVEGASASSAGRPADILAGNGSDGLAIARSHSLDVKRMVLAEGASIGNTATAAACAVAAGNAAPILKATNISYSRPLAPPAVAALVSASSASVPRPLMARMSIDTSMSLFSSASTLAPTAARAPSGLRGFEHLEHYHRLHSPDPNWIRWSRASATGMTSSPMGSTASVPATGPLTARCYGASSPPAHPLSPDAYIGDSLVHSPSSAKISSGGDRILESSVAFSPRPSNRMTSSAVSTSTGMEASHSPVIMPSQSERFSRLSATIGDTVAISVQQDASDGVLPWGLTQAMSSNQQGPGVQHSPVGSNGVVAAAGGGSSGTGAAKVVKCSSLSSRHSVDITVLSHQVSTSPVMWGSTGLLTHNAVSDGGQSAAVPARCGPRVSSLIAPPLSRASEGCMGSGGGVYQCQSSSMIGDTNTGGGAGDTVRMKGELRKILEPSAHGLMQQGQLAARGTGPLWSQQMQDAALVSLPGAGDASNINATAAGAAGLDIACMLARASERSAGITLAPSPSTSTAMVATAAAAQGQQSNAGGAQLPPAAAIPPVHEPVAVEFLLGVGMTDVQPVADGASTCSRSGDMDTGGEGNNVAGGGGNCCSVTELYQKHPHNHTASHQHRLAHSYGVANGLVQPLIPSRLDPVEEGCGSSAALTGELEDGASADGSVGAGRSSMEGAKEHSTTPADDPRVKRCGTISHDAAFSQQQAAAGQQGSGLQGSLTLASGAVMASTATPQLSRPAVASDVYSALSANGVGTGFTPAPVERLQAKQVEAVSKRSFSSLVRKVRKALRSGEVTGRGGR